MDVPLIETKQRKSSNFLNILCCVYESDDDDQGDEEKSLQSDFLRLSQSLNGKKEKLELVLLGNMETGYYSLVRVTQKNFLIDLQQKKVQIMNQRIQKLNRPMQPLAMVNPATFLYGLFEYGIQINQGEIHTTLPEKVMRYVAKRCEKYNTFVDGYCASGSSSIFLACEMGTKYILAMDPSFENVNYARDNANIYDVIGKIDLFQGDFVHSRIRIKPDVVFVHPKQKLSSSYVLQPGIEQDIEAIMQKALDLSLNVILVLPTSYSLREISEKLSCVLMKNFIQIHKYEIQLIQIDGVVTYYIVYVGDVACVQNQDEYEYATLQILKDIKQQHLVEPVYKMLKLVSRQASFRDILDMLQKSQHRASLRAETILQNFIYSAQYYQYISKEETERLFTYDDQEKYMARSTPRMKELHQNSVTFQKNNSNSNSIEYPKPNQQSNTKAYQSFAPQQEIISKPVMNDSLLLRNDESINFASTKIG